MPSMIYTTFRKIFRKIFNSVSSYVMNGCRSVDAVKLIHTTRWMNQCLKQIDMRLRKNPMFLTLNINQCLLLSCV